MQTTYTLEELLKMKDQAMQASQQAIREKEEAFEREMAMMLEQSESEEEGWMNSDGEMVTSGSDHNSNHAKELGTGLKDNNWDVHGQADLGRRAGSNFKVIREPAPNKVSSDENSSDNAGSDNTGSDESGPEEVGSRDSQTGSSVRREVKPVPLGQAVENLRGVIQRLKGATSLDAAEQRGSPEPQADREVVPCDRCRKTRKRCFAQK